MIRPSAPVVPHLARPTSSYTAGGLVVVLAAAAAAEQPKRCGGQNCTYVKRVEPRIAVNPTHRCRHVVPAVKNQSHTPISQR